MPDLQKHHQDLLDDGYTIVESVLDMDLVDALSSDVGRLESKLGIETGDNRFEGHSTTRIYNLLAHGELWQEVPVQPQVLELIVGVLGRECLISSLSSIAIGPGETGQVIHADDQIQALAKPHAATVCNSMWALTDFTEANGATRVVPRSHGWDSPDYFADPSETETVPAEMARGSVMVWHGSLWHGGGANTTTNQVRVGIAMNYCAGFIRQQENQQLGIPAEVMATFSPQLRDLCGLGIYRGLIGHIEKKSPAHLLYGDLPQGQLWDKEQM